MATITAAGAGNWSTGATWNGGIVPGDGDTADLNGFVVVMNIPTIPASGTLLALIGVGNIGQLSVNLATLGDSTINATDIICGNTTSGFVYMFGTAPTKILTVNGNVSGCAGTNSLGLRNYSTGGLIINGNVTGGSGTGTQMVRNNSTGPVTVNGNVVGGSSTSALGVFNFFTGPIIINGTVTGGSADLAVGVYNNSTGSINITGNITGGSATRTYGVYSVSTGVVTLNSCNLINSAFAVAYAGYPPVWNLNANNYLQWGTVYFAQQLLDHQILTGVVNGTITGVRTDCLVAQAIEAASYGDPASLTLGTYHEADVSEVKDGVMFGALSILEGTYDHYSIIGGHHIIQPARAA